MAKLKDILLDQIRRIEGVDDRPSPVAGGTALFYRGKAFAHFHNDNELDLRLTKKAIQSLGLVHPPGSTHHPARSASSAWIEIRFNTAGELLNVVELIRLAIEQIKD